MDIFYPGLSIEYDGSVIKLRLKSIDSDSFNGEEKERDTTKNIADMFTNEVERVNAIFKGVCELTEHEVHEWFYVDGVRWIAPHNGQQTHQLKQPKIYLKAHEYSSVRAVCVSLLDHFSCHVDVLMCGSVLDHYSFNDIDVRFFISDKDYRNLASTVHPRNFSFMLTHSARERTNLPIDIQVNNIEIKHENRSYVDVLNYRGSIDI